MGEARERRDRQIRVHGSLFRAYYRRPTGQAHRHDRRWCSFDCEADGHVGFIDHKCERAEDVALDDDGIPVAMCPDCRAAQAPAIEFKTETLEDLAAEFLDDIARILPSCADQSPPQGES